MNLSIHKQGTIYEQTFLVLEFFKTNIETHSDVRVMGGVMFGF